MNYAGKQGDEMKVNFKPYEDITFKSHLIYEGPEEFVKIIGLSTPPGVPSRTRLFWANGVLFRHFSFAPSESVVQANIDGHLVWDHVEFAPMKEYKPELQGGTERPLVTVFVLDVTNHVVFDPLTKWIKDNLL